MRCHSLLFLCSGVRGLGAHDLLLCLSFAYQVPCSPITIDPFRFMRYFELDARIIFLNVCPRLVVGDIAVVEQFLEVFVH